MAYQGPARRHVIVTTWSWFLLLAFIIAVFAMRAPAHAQDVATAAPVQATVITPEQLETVSKLDAVSLTETEPPGPQGPRDFWLRQAPRPDQQAQEVP